MSRLRETIREDTRYRILRLLADNPNLSQRELANAVGVSAGSVHYVLNALIEAGLIKIGNFRAAEDRRRYAYLLTPEGIAQQAEITRRFLVRKVEEFEALRSEIEALRAELEAADGRALGRLPEAPSPRQAGGVAAAARDPGA